MKSLALAFLSTSVFLVFTFQNCSPKSSTQPLLASEKITGTDSSLNNVSLASKDTSSSLCFQREDLAQTRWTVSVFAVPTAKDQWPETSPYYPANLFSGRPQNVLPVTPEGHSYPMLNQLWANRCHYIKSAKKASNQTSGEGECHLMSARSEGNESLGVNGRGVVFSSYWKANVCTVLQARRLVSKVSDAVLKKIAQKNGLVYLPRISDMSKYWDVYKEKVTFQLANNKTEHGDYMVNVCVAPSDGSTTNDGISLDYEVADDRPNHFATGLMSALSRVAHGSERKLVVFTHALTKEANTYGIDRHNFRQILKMVDLISLNTATGAGKAYAGNPDRHIPARPARYPVRTLYQSYLQSLKEIEMTDKGRVALSRAEQSKILWGIGLFYTDLRDARNMVKTLLEDNAYAGITIQRAFVPQGGACDRVERHLNKDIPVNQVIACLSLGVCDGEFRMRTNL